MKEGTKEAIKIFLMIVLLLVVVFSILILVSNMQIINEKMSYGQSSFGFCKKEGGTYEGGFFIDTSCYIGETKYYMYYDRGSKMWRLAK